MTSWKKRLKQVLRPDFAETMDNELEILTARYRELSIDRQIDYGKFCLYSIITHSTAIEGSTITELENRTLKLPTKDPRNWRPRTHRSRSTCLLNWHRSS